MANNDFWALIFEPVTTALNGLRDEVRATKLELAALRVAAQEIARALPPLPAVRFIFSGQIENEPRKDNIKMLLLTDIQKCTLSIAQADADLGAGIVTIAGTLDVSVAASQATSLNIAAGTPEPQ